MKALVYYLGMRLKLYLNFISRVLKECGQANAVAFKK